MGILTKISDYFNARYDAKLERGLLRLNDKIKYNPDFSRLGAEYMTSERRARLLTQYLVWFMGDEYILSNYYKNQKIVLGQESVVDTRMFWRVAPDDIIKVHTGMPSLISNKKSRLLWGQPVTIDVEVFKVDENGNVSEDVDEEASKKLRSILVDVIIPRVNLNDNVKKATVEESYSGHHAIKLSFDRQISPFPIVETADARLFSVTKERGHTTAITFHEWYSNAKKNKKYRRDEIYTTVRPTSVFPSNEDILAYARQWVYKEQRNAVELGDAIITNDLYELKDSKEIPIKFDDWNNHCPELMGGIAQETYVFPGLKGMLAFEKPNRLPNKDFPGSWYGESDYSGVLSSFDKLDELYSENTSEVRENKSIYVYPIEWMDKDDQGKVTGKDKFKTNYVSPKVDMDQAQGKEPAATVLSGSDRTDSFVKKWRMEVGMICANAHISPTSLGGLAAGFESIVAGPESQQEREKDTIDTRNEMIGRWGPYLESILLKLLELNSFLLNNGYIDEQPGIESMPDVDFDNCNVRVQFPDYAKASDMELITTWGQAMNMRVADIKTAVERIYRTLSSDQQQEIVDRIKLENGLTLDNPESLRMEDLIDQNINNEGGEEE